MSVAFSSSSTRSARPLIDALCNGVFSSLVRELTSILAEVRSNATISLRPPFTAMYSGVLLSASQVLTLIPGAFNSTSTIRSCPEGPSKAAQRHQRCKQRRPCATASS
ncbi:hypothetical protein PBRA_006364 [Plasmodiophora brassicae]|uniref:Uncharacterized protein n=1 Tax=Plasmodiophora brassicae TaxID=37360 RepID=A0A0G4ISK9_PLABS|nr:hypothetical protein PBRA_006364 [Plasmodiophora brassicae]